jgi:hypothetical protein
MQGPGPVAPAFSNFRLAPVFIRRLKLTLTEWRERYCFKEERSLRASSVDMNLDKSVAGGGACRPE